jgi:3-dehydroquinate dehydratase II
MVNDYLLKSCLERASKLCTLGTNMPNILFLNGPNLNLLGQRETSHYGETTLPQIEERVKVLGESLGHTIAFFQSNAEHVLIEKIQAAAMDKVDFIVINPGGFTHTSVALRDSLLAVGLPFIEVHLSNIYARESFRNHSYFSDIARGVIVGFGPKGYELALYALT